MLERLQASPAQGESFNFMEIKRVQFFCNVGLPELSQALYLNLPNSLRGNASLISEFFEF